MIRIILHCDAICKKISHCDVFYFFCLFFSCSCSIKSFTQARAIGGVRLFPHSQEHQVLLDVPVFRIASSMLNPASSLSMRNSVFSSSLFFFIFLPYLFYSDGELTFTQAYLDRWQPPGSSTTLASLADRPCPGLPGSFRAASRLLGTFLLSPGGALPGEFDCQT